MLLDQKDKTLYLLFAEIHLKNYFDYKGGNIIGLSDNSNEFISTFCFYA